MYFVKVKTAPIKESWENTITAFWKLHKICFININFFNRMGNFLITECALFSCNIQSYIILTEWCLSSDTRYHVLSWLIGVSLSDYIYHTLFCLSASIQCESGLWSRITESVKWLAVGWIVRVRFAVGAWIFLVAIISKLALGPSSLLSSG
jgi:hypothetical protein